MTIILLTGFGPFPGAPFNPTEVMVRRLACERRPALADVTVVPHIFRTSYVAIDRELPALIRRHKPDALLMFGLAQRTPHLRVETLARNAVTRMPDVDRNLPKTRMIAKGKPGAIALRTPAHPLVAAARAARVPVALSRNAGRYLCNYLCWHATAAMQKQDGPGLAVFIHVPLVERGPVPSCRTKSRRVKMPDLTRAGRAFLKAVAAAARR